MKTINVKIRDEKERIKKYRDETGRMVLEDVDVNDLPGEHFSTISIVDSNDFNLDARSMERSNFKLTAPSYEKYLADDCVGFQKCDDETFRIQGSFGLDNSECREIVNACHFTGIFAIMYAVHHPVESMNYRSVDIILENGERITKNVSLDEYQKARTMKILVDTTSYELMTVDYNPKKAKPGDSSSENEVKALLKEFFTHHKYGLIRSKSCCLVVIKESNCYQLFDPHVDGNLPAAWFKLDNFEAVFNYLLTWKCHDPTDISLVRVQSVKVLSYKTTKPPKVGYFLFNFPSTPTPSNQKSCQTVEDSDDEKIEWITNTETIPWSRLEPRNAMNVERYLSISKWKEFDVEMDNKLYSLWGNVHPGMKIFKIHAGKQHLTCAVISLVMAHMYNIDEWDAILLDSIVAHGHKYHLESISEIQQPNHQLKIEDLRPICSINNFAFDVKIKPIINGTLYEENRRSFNLNRALNYVFRHRNLPGVILQCNGKFLAVGNVNNRDFFVFDSQAHGPPLFSFNQGTSYVLKCCCLKVLLACIVLTLNTKRHNVPFHVYAVDAQMADVDGRGNYGKEAAGNFMPNELVSNDDSYAVALLSFSEAFDKATASEMAKASKQSTASGKTGFSDSRSGSMITQAGSSFRKLPASASVNGPTSATPDVEKEPSVVIQHFTTPRNSQESASLLVPSILRIPSEPASGSTTPSASKTKVSDSMNFMRMSIIIIHSSTEIFRV
jgi:hypothetical protein